MDIVTNIPQENLINDQTQLLIKHFKNFNIEYKCLFCNKIYISKFCLERHLENCKYDIDNLKLYQIIKINDLICLFCNKIYANKYVLERHLKNKCKLIFNKNKLEIYHIIQNKLNFYTIITNIFDNKIIEYKKILLKDLKNFFYNKNNKEKDKEWRLKNIKKIKIRLKKWNENNKNKIQQYIQKLKCKKCGLYITQKKNNWLCSICNPVKANRQKTKELRVKTFLEENNYIFIYNKKCNLDDTCMTYFPDFIIDCCTFFLIIECDEYAHESYDYNCERIRENNICFALGLPCVFLRYNPDKDNINIKTKEKILKSYIEYYKNKESSDNMLEFLFY
jgi:rubrerythrin